MLSIMQFVVLHHQTLLVLLCHTLLHACYSSSNCIVTFWMPWTLNRLMVHNDWPFYIPVIQLEVHKLDLYWQTKLSFRNRHYIIPTVSGIVGYFKMEKTARNILQHLWFVHLDHSGEAGSEFFMGKIWRLNACST